MPSPASARTCSSACSTWASTSGWRALLGSGRCWLAIGPTSSPASWSGWPGPRRKSGRRPPLGSTSWRRSPGSSPLNGHGSTSWWRRAAEEQGRADEATAHARLLDGVRAPAGVDDLATALATVTAARQRCAEIEDDATEAVTMAEAQLAGLPARAALETLRADHGRRRELAEAVERGRAAEAKAAGDLALARDAEELASGERKTTRRRARPVARRVPGPGVDVRAGGGIALPGVRAGGARPSGVPWRTRPASGRAAPGRRGTLGGAGDGGRQ